VGEGQIDPVALATWHEALSNTLSVEVPHDLMGLWLYPIQGGVVLLGPAELAQDDLVIPTPAPYLKPEQLSRMEEVVVNAGYHSATCLPIRFGKQDVGLLLVAGLQSDRYGAVERVVLQCVAQRVGPMLGRIARQWTPAAGGPSSGHQERVAGLLQTVAGANLEGTTPQLFLAAISNGLAPLLPHDHLELLAQDESGSRYFRLGEHPGGPLWTDPSLIISPDHLDIASVFRERTRLLVPDIYEDERWPRGFLTAAEPPGAHIRSVAGARLNLRGEGAAYLLAGSIAPDLYGAEDVELLVLLGGLILPQIAEFLRAPEPEKLVTGPSPDAKPAELLLGIASALATITDGAAATRLIAVEGSALLPFETLTFALRSNVEGRIVMVNPGERRVLGDLPVIEIAGSELEWVLEADVPNALVEDADKSRLIVPLRVAGRVQGALVFSAASSVLKESHAAEGQRLADVVAAHLELLRRNGMATRSRTPLQTGRKQTRALPAAPPSWQSRRNEPV
jgi:hypothetical protein